MESIYLIIFFVLTFVTSLGIISYSQKLRYEGVRQVMKSQSSIYNIVKQFTPKVPKTNDQINSQSRNYVSEKMIRIIAIDDYAYWVKDNKFFSASLLDGKIDHSTTQEVNTINMSQNDVDKMLFILDRLKDEEE
jgi:hypothetical protein